MRLSVFGIVITVINMFLNLIKFCHKCDLLNRTLVRYISSTSCKSTREVFNFLENKKEEVANTLRNNHNQPTFARKYATNRTSSTPSSYVIGTLRDMATVEETAEFISLFPVIVSDLIETIQCGNIPIVRKHIEKVLQYNVPTGKKYRGLGLVTAYKMIESPDNLNSNNIQLANILGWCTEIYEASLLVIDDIMDQSETRRGKTCWYKVKGVGLSGFNDGIIIEQVVYLLLKKYFANHPNYLQILETFHYIDLKTNLGQRLDLMLMTDGKPNFEFFTIETYKLIAKYKTSYHTTYLPIALAMHLAQKFNVHPQTKSIILEMGEFYQIQNDFADCFDTSESKGKKGNDICVGKCTWLAVVALQRGSPEQIKTFKAHYGKGNNKESEQIVINLYEEIGLPNIYKIYEEQSFHLLHSRIQQTSEELPRALILKYLENMYGRSYIAA